MLLLGLSNINTDVDVGFTERLAVCYVSLFSILVYYCVLNLKLRQK